MAQYVYIAKNIDGKLVRGSLDASDEKDVRIQLRAQRLIPQKISDASKVKKKKSGEAGGGSIFGPAKVKDKDLQVFSRQFATMIEAGITIVEALEILSRGLPRGVMKVTVDRIKNSVETGKSLGEAMEMHPHVFDRLYVNMIKAGEESGALDQILERICSYIEKSSQLKGKVKSALAYPVVIILVSIVVVSLLLIFIVPKFTELFSSAGQEPPWLTQVVVDLSHGLVSNWMYFLGVTVAAILGLRMYFSTKEGAVNRDYILLNLPIFGELVKKSGVARMSRTLSTLLSSGVSVLEALNVAAGTVGNAVMEGSLRKARASIATGKTIAGPLSNAKEIPDMVVQMVAVGEASGTMDVMLGKIADFYESEVDVVVDILSSLIEPLLMVVLGGIIAIIVIAMYLPIFQMANVVGA